METIKINPKDLQFSPWNVNTVSPENMEKLKKSIQRNGIFKPVVVRRVDNEYVVIAGEHTTRIAIELGYETIDAYDLGEISDVRAKEIAVLDNQHFGVEDQYGLGKLLQEIQAVDGVSAAEFLPFSDRELTSIFKSSTINLETLDLDDEEIDRIIPDYNPEESMARAPIDHQIMRFKVPIKDAERVTRTIEAIIKRQGLKQPDSLASAGDALVWLCNNRGTEE